MVGSSLLRANAKLITKGVGRTTWKIERHRVNKDRF